MSPHGRLPMVISSLSFCWSSTSSCLICLLGELPVAIRLVSPSSRRNNFAQAKVGQVSVWVSAMSSAASSVTRTTILVHSCCANSLASLLCTAHKHTISWVWAFACPKLDVAVSRRSRRRPPATFLFQSARADAPCDCVPPFVFLFLPLVSCGRGIRSFCSFFDQCPPLSGPSWTPSGAPSSWVLRLAVSPAVCLPMRRYHKAQLFHILRAFFLKSLYMLCSLASCFAGMLLCGVTRSLSSSDMIATPPLLDTQSTRRKGLQTGANTPVVPSL